MVVDAGDSYDGDDDHYYVEAKEYSEPKLLVRFDSHSPEQRDRDYQNY